MARGDQLYPTIAVQQLDRIVEQAERFGVDPDALRRDSGMSDLTGTGRAPARILFDLWELAVTRSGNPALPLELARETPLDAFGLLGFTVMTSPSMATALECGTSYYALLSDSGSWRLTTRPHEVHAEWSRPGSLTAGKRISTESVLAHFISGCRAIAGEHTRPKLVRFRHEAPPSYRALMEYFDTKVEFGAQEDALVFSREEMDRTPLLANAPLNEFLRSAADQMLAPIRLPAFADRVRKELYKELPSGSPNMHEVARALGTTRRTLHRKLAAEGTTFRELMEQIRKDEARARLGDANTSLTSLALDLGFADLSTFSRAHRRWFGLSPSRLRNR
jgi:AraC-like DNA-binding protein